MLRRNSDRNDPMAGSRTPQLFLQVCSRDSWDRHGVEGFGFLSIPAAPGVYEEVVRTWRMLPSVRDKLGHFLIGGVGQIDDLQSAAISMGHTGPFLSKHGLRTESSGSVRVRLNVMHQVRPLSLPPLPLPPPLPLSPLRCASAPPLTSPPFRYARRFLQVQKPEPAKVKARPKMRRAAGDIISRLRKEGRIGRQTALKKTYKEVAHLVNSLKTYNKPLIHDPSQPAVEEMAGPLSPTRAGGGGGGAAGEGVRERAPRRQGSRRSLSPNRRSTAGTPSAARRSARAAKKEASTPTADI